MIAASSDNVLQYASVHVPTHHRRTLAGTVLRWIGRGIALLFLLLRLVFLAAGYIVIALGQLVRLGFGIAGALLLLLGGLRWHEIRGRLMRGAHWVDRTTMRLVRAVSRNPFAAAPRAAA